MEENQEKLNAIEECVKRIATPKEHEYFTTLLTELVENNTIPEELLEFIPVSPQQACKTRFDQLYDAAMFLVFPKYKRETIVRLLGPINGSNKKIRRVKIWRAMFPKEFNLSHVLIRASSFQEAFALGCDYACRLSLRLYKKIPIDLTIRIQFMNEKSIKRILDIRHANKLKRRRQFQFVGRKHSAKEITGAKIVAIGNSRSEKFSIAKFAESKDLQEILSKKSLIRVSAIELETYRSK